jgi:hypothetical protein
LNPSLSPMVVFTSPQPLGENRRELGLACPGLEVDIYMEAEPTPILCYPTVNLKGYAGLRHSK